MGWEIWIMLEGFTLQSHLDYLDLHEINKRCTSHLKNKDWNHGKGLIRLSDSHSHNKCKEDWICASVKATLKKQHIWAFGWPSGKDINVKGSGSILARNLCWISSPTPSLPMIPILLSYLIQIKNRQGCKHNLFPALLEINEYWHYTLTQQL